MACKAATQWPCRLPRCLLATGNLSTGVFSFKTAMRDPGSAVTPPGKVGELAVTEGRCVADLSGAPHGAAAQPNDLLQTPAPQRISVRVRCRSCRALTDKHTNAMQLGLSVPCLATQRIQPLLSGFARAAH